ncbi:MAG TPA: Npt1/Npt2 family nucleotide transporter, partial [Bacteroidales bacterium]
MQLNIFLIISTLLIVKPTVNGLFISQFGVESLPLAFVIVALFATVLSIFYSRKLIKIPLHSLIGKTLGISVITLIVFGILLLLNILVSWVIYLFYIWVALFAVLSASQFWILANMVFNSREAKRFFGFIGAGAIAGGIFGGYLTSLLAPTLGAEKLLFVSAALLWFCIPITRTVWRENISGKNNPQKNLQEMEGVGESPFQLIRKSKHLTYLAGIVGVSVIVAKLVDYQFNAIASEKISDPDELTAFFGFWFSNINLISLVIQLFITRRVVGVFGVGTSLFFLPAGIFIGATLVLFAPSLFAVVIIKLADGSLKQSINKSAAELLALPIPLSIKNKAKTFIDVFVDSVATGIGGLILILLVNAFQISVPFISLMILVMLGVWFYFALKVRKEYIKSFQLKLKQTSTGKEVKAINFSNESVIGGLKKVIEIGNEKQILWILQKVRENPNEKLFDSIFQLLEHPNGNIRAEALRNLYFYKNKNITVAVYKKIVDPEQEVKIAAFEYLLEHNPQNRLELMQEFLNDADYKVSGAALLSLAGEFRNNPELKKQYELRQVIAKRIEDLQAEKQEEVSKFKTKIILEAIGKGHLISFFTFIENGLNHSDPDVVNQAIKAAGLSKAPEFIEKLIEFIPNPKYAANTAFAFAQYGVEVLSILQTIFEDETKKDTQRKIPSIIENIDSQLTVKFLFGLLNSEDFQVRQEALTSLNNIKAKFPFLYFDKKIVIRRILDEARLLQDTLSVLYLQTKLEKESNISGNTKISEARASLIVLLERRLDGGLDRVFRLLGLKFPIDEISSAYKSFQSSKIDIRLSSIEFLDNLLDTRLKRVLIPIFETTVLETISKEALQNLNIHIPDEIECYTMLLDGNDIKIKLAVLYLISLLKGEQYISLVNKYVENSNLKVQTFAKNALAALTKN